MSECHYDNRRWPGAVGEIFSEHFARREWSLVQSGTKPFYEDHKESQKVKVLWNPMIEQAIMKFLLNTAILHLINSME